MNSIPKQKIAIIVRTHTEDLKLFETLYESIERYNVENIPIVVICPKNCIDPISNISSCIRIVDEKELLDEEPYSVRGLSKGYITQELLNLSFHYLEEYENYLSVDSDSKFLKPFYVSDFFDDRGDLYTVLTEDKDLQIDPYYASYSSPRQNDIRKIFQAFELPNKKLLQVQLNPLISQKASRSLSDVGFPSIGVSKMQALEISPFDFNWYTAWLLKSKVIPVVPTEPLFKTFHTRSQYVHSLSQGLTEKHIAQAYIGVIYNSNWFKRYQNETRIKRHMADIRTDHYYYRALKSLKRRIPFV